MDNFPLGGRAATNADLRWCWCEGLLTTGKTWFSKRTFQTAGKRHKCNSARRPAYCSPTDLWRRVSMPISAHMFCTDRQLQPPTTRRTSKPIRSSGCIWAAGNGELVGQTPSAIKPEGLGPGLVKQVCQFVSSQYLPLGLLAALGLGYLAPGPGVQLAQWQMSKFCTVAIFIITGLLLERGEATKAISAWGSLLFGTASILLFTPLIAPLLLKLPFQPPELALGLAIFSLTPTTLSSGVALMQICGGNVAMALLLTLVTNFAGVFTVPFSLPFILGKATPGSVVLSPWMLLVQLLQTVLFPALCGILAKVMSKSLCTWVREHKRQLSLLSSLLLVMVPWMQVSLAVQSKTIITVPMLMATVGIGVAVHILYLAVNAGFVGAMQLGGPNPRDARAIQRAVILLSSQKTLLMSVTVLAQLSAVLGGSIGIAVVPCVLAHLGQIVVDSVLVSSWIEKDKTKQV